MLKIKLLVAVSVVIVLLSGCNNNIPKPTLAGKKPTVYVKSLTLEKYKGINGTNTKEYGYAITPRFASSESYYMRCDMSDEARAVFGRYGFELVNNDEDADYTFEVTVSRCWNRNERKYLSKTRGILLPNKYRKMSDEDKITLNRFYAKYPRKKISQKHSHLGLSLMDYGYQPDDLGVQNTTSHLGADTFSQGARIASTGSSSVGAVGMGLGVLFSIGGVREPRVSNQFKIINNKTGKFWEHETNFNTSPQSWYKNTYKPMDDWTIDEIPWGDLE